MSTAGRIATTLDLEMLGPALLGAQDIRKSADRPGTQVAVELGGRYLLRYIRRYQVGNFATGADEEQWLTPTAYTPEEALPYLALPKPQSPPLYVLFIDPARVPLLKGPGRVRLGAGIEYLLPYGFPADAMVHPGWEIEIT
ncbi:hypothetical protein [Streptomyces sp. NPDC002402]